MAVLSEIRKRPWLLMGAIAIALLAFVVNPDSINKWFGKNPDVLGKVNGEKITREEFNDQLYVLQNQAKQQGQPEKGLENQAWNMLVQSKIIAQQFEKMGLKMTDDLFYNQMQFDPMFANNPQFFDEKGNFKIQDVKKQIEQMKADPNPQYYNDWLKNRKFMEYRIMARQVFANLSNAITTSQKEATEMARERDTNYAIDYVNIDYATFAQKNPVKVTTQDLADYIKLHPVTFKTEATRNIGLAYFPATPSAADDAATLAEINKLYSGTPDGGGENFTATKNDSLFISTNSDAPFNAGYFSAAQLPAELKDKVITASVGQTFGPTKLQNVYVVTKLLGKKTSDSTLARHILISYKGNPAAAGTSRTKEQAKKLADSILAAVKADPAKFAELSKLSSDKSSAVQGGNLGWSTSTQPKYVPAFEKFVDESPKGATGEVETQFGYHIINIQDKKTGGAVYKVANLVKTIKPSDATEANVDKNARRFIQQVQGKSFNDFQNIAKKNNYNLQNPRAVKRFDGQLQGLGTDKDGDIIAWAFDKKRNPGDTEFFTVEGTGDKIVAYYNGKQDAGTADPESVRPQIEQLVKNKLIAKKISGKINSAKITTLDQAAKMFGVAKQSGQINLLNPQIATGMEPKVAGAAAALAANKLSQPIEGKTGVFLAVKKGETYNKQPADPKQIAQAISQQKAQMFGQSFLKSLQDNADIKDYRAEVWAQKEQ